MKSSTHSPKVDDEGENSLESNEVHVPWSAEQAQTWRQTQQQVPIYGLVAAQFGVALVVALIAFAIFGSKAAMSAGYGGLCAAVPSALLARGMRSALSRGNAIIGFMVWEWIKMAMGVAMLVAAPFLISQVNWIALIVGLVLTLKTVFLAALWPHKAVAKS